MLPEWLDADRLQWIILGFIAVLFVAMFMVMRFIRQLITKFLLFVLLAGFGFSLWLQRADLQQCAETCECSLYGEEVAIPVDRRPASCGGG
ncbi:MAG: hypothetical protein AAGC53_13005 [Actinomycetota bacterium]